MISHPLSDNQWFRSRQIDYDNEEEEMPNDDTDCPERQDYDEQDV
jgi:hypothetical protein